MTDKRSQMSGGGIIGVRVTQMFGREKRARRDELKISPELLNCVGDCASVCFEVCRAASDGVQSESAEC